MTRPWTVLAVVPLLATLVAGCADEDEPRGVVRDARPAQVGGTDLWAQLPTGRVTVTVGEPVRTIPGDDVDGGEAIDAGDGAEFVPVAVEYDDLAGVPADAPQGDTEPDDVTKLTLHVGDGAYPVPFDHLGTASYLEVATSSGPELSLEVEFDGLTQRVDADGERTTPGADGLYDAATSTELQSCGEHAEERPPGVDPAWLRSCRYHLWEFPYVEGLGWASKRQPGATWVVVSAQTWLRADQLDVAGAPCRVAAMGGSARVRVDGQAATEELAVSPIRRAGGRGLGVRVAFLLTPADQHELEITSTWGCRLGDRGADREFVDRVSASS